MVEHLRSFLVLQRHGQVLASLPYRVGGRSGRLNLGVQPQAVDGSCAFIYGSENHGIEAKMQMTAAEAPGSILAQSDGRVPMRSFPRLI